MEKEKISKEIIEIYTKMVCEWDDMKRSHIDFSVIQLDSLGIVKFVTEIEDKYCIKLDKLLVRFSNAVSLNEIIETVYNQINEQA